MRASVLALFVACSAPPAPSPRAVTPPQPPPPTPAPDPFAALNLGFEDTDGALPKGWGKPLTPGYEVTSVGDAHGGTRALQLRATGDGKFGASMRELPLEPVKGKRLRLHAWIKSDAVAHGYAGLWMLADGEDRALDNTAGRGVAGTSPWKEVTAEIVVPETATRVVLGPLLVGEGRAVYDDLRLELSDVPKPHPINLDGQVVDAGGAPVAGAEVALIATGLIDARVQSDANGRFHFAPMSGRWGVSAQKAGALATFRDQEVYNADANLTLTLGRAGAGVVIAGKTTGANPRFVMIAPGSNHDADLFVVPVAADGTFAAEVPVGDEYRVEVIDGGVGRKIVPDTGRRVEVTLAVASDGPPPQPVVDWIAAHAIPLASTDPAHDLSDLAPLTKLVGKARIVALGEATHGTREFFQLKHRVLAYLVEKLGFTTFAIEDNQPECRAINDYVLRGTGDARSLLATLSWTWQTEEMLALIEWMRAYDADPKHKTKVQFAGFDMQTSEVAPKNVAAYLAKVGGDPALLADVEALGRTFDANKKAWTAKASDFDDARHDVAILEQAALMAADPMPFAARDRAMADNVGWLLDHQPKGGRIVLWAHNGHIANTLIAFTNMGSHLRKKYKADYRNLGFVFSQGAFQAMVGNPPSLKLKEITVGPPSESDTSVAFARTGKPLLLLDLRALPKTGGVRDWFSVERPTRDVGALFVSERVMGELMSLPALYDAVIFVGTTTRARPIKPQ